MQSVIKTVKDADNLRRDNENNRLFENNQRQFYRELDQEQERCDDDQPMAEESKEFWGNIWSPSAGHKKDVKWLQDLRSEVIVKKQEKIDITTGTLKKILGRMPNWKSLRPDFTFKNFRCNEKIKVATKRTLRSWVCA